MARLRIEISLDNEDACRVDAANSEHDALGYLVMCRLVDRPEGGASVVDGNGNTIGKAEIERRGAVAAAVAALVEAYAQEHGPGAVHPAVERVRAALGDAEL